MTQTLQMKVSQFIVAGLALLIGTLFYGFFGWLVCLCFGIMPSVAVSLVTGFISTFFQVWVSLSNTEALQEKLQKNTHDLPPDDEQPPEL